PGPRPAEHAARRHPAVLLHDPVRGLLHAAVLPRDQPRGRGVGDARRRRSRPHLLPDHRADVVDTHDDPRAADIHHGLERVLLAAPRRAGRGGAGTHRRARHLPVADATDRAGLGGTHGGRAHRGAPRPPALPRLRATTYQQPRLLRDQVAASPRAPVLLPKGFAMTHLARPLARLGIGAAALGLAVAGCSSGSDDASATGGAQISYWLWDSNQQPAYQQCAEDFAAEHDITVTIEQFGWADYWQGLTTGFASDTAPDVFANHLSYYPEFVAQGQLLGISERIEGDGLDLSIYQDGLADLWQDEEGERYGLPKDFDTVALFYNEQMAADAGLTAESLAELEWNPDDGGTFEQAVAAL